MSKKKIITIISLLVVVTLSISAISYSIATFGSGDGTSKEIDTELVQRGAANYKTNIDLIIENANDNNETFNVVEILPPGYKGSGTFLNKYIEDGYFKTDVFDANSKLTMAADMIKLDTIEITKDTNLETTMITSNITGESSRLYDVLNKADLIYVSGPSYSAYNNGKMNEDVYNYLHTYALGKNKPIIFDFVRKSDTGSTSGSKTYKNLVNEIRGNWKRFKTFQWPETYDAKHFFTGAGDSYYLKYLTGNSNKTPDGKAKVLIITTNENEAASMYGKLKAGTADDDSLNDIIETAYYGNSRPKGFEYTVKDPTATSGDRQITSESDFDGYDFIFIEKNVLDCSISNEFYAKLKTLSESSKYIFIAYDSNMFVDDDAADAGQNNYLKLQSLLMTANGIAKQSNILSSRYGFFESLYNTCSTGGDGKPSAKAIADIINTGIYRDYDNESGRKYRVLEIEPCYPIDLEMAEANKVSTSKNYTGGYYTYPDEVLYGVSKEEIDNDTEYYAFELTKAKIAHALDLDYNQIEIVSMSTNELISSKEVIADNYDLVYVGGDVSALNVLENFPFCNSLSESSALANLITGFNMYSHTGFWVQKDSEFSYGNVAGGDNYVSLNGNDITTIKMDELNAYVDAGLPIIIDKVVTDAFLNVYNKRSRLEQLSTHDIDPDSNMYKFLKSTYEKIQKPTKYYTDNVMWGKAKAADSLQSIDNSERVYGNTRGSTVTVYSEAYKKEIKNMIGNSKTRPSIKIVSAPIEYEEGNDDTTNTEEEATFKVNLTELQPNETYTLELSVDSDGDGLFSEDELIQTITSASSSETLVYTLPQDFFGLVSWQIKVSADSNGLSDIQSGCAYFKPDSSMKKTVRVLQVMPVEYAEMGSNGSGHSLYFCTDCQQAARILNYNVVIRGSNRYGASAGLNSFEDSSTVNGVYVGKHDHNFGIVKFDSTTHIDDWESNFADTLADDFDFDLDIVTVSEFDKYCAEAVKRGKSSDYSMADAYEVYSDLYDDYQVAAASSELQTAEEVLENAMFNIVEDVESSSSDQTSFKTVILNGIGTKDNPGSWIVNKQYYRFWEHFNKSRNQNLWMDFMERGNASKQAKLQAVKDAYADYIKLKDEVVDAKEAYKVAARQCGVAENDTTTGAVNWLNNNYDIVILGLADEFAGKDLKAASCTQLEDYVKNGGMLLNSHDTTAKKSSEGAVNLTNTLRNVFGMDRYHVTGLASDDDTSVSAALHVDGFASDPAQVTQNFGNYILYPASGDQISLNNNSKDLEIDLYKRNQYSGDSAVIVKANREVGDHGEGDYTDVKIKLTVYDGENSTTPVSGYKFILRDTSWNTIGEYTTNAAGQVVISIPQQISGEGWMPATSMNLSISKDEIKNISYVGTITKNNLSLGNATTTDLASGSSDFTVGLKLTTDGTNPVPSELGVSLKIGSTTYTGKTDGSGNVTFTVPVTAITEYSEDIYSTSSGSKYRRYKTTNSNKYFWTERLKVDAGATLADYETEFNKVANNFGIISPIGFTDLFACPETTSYNRSPYKYITIMKNDWNHRGTATDSDGSNFQAHYGTRRAQQVNKGYITAYPFAISNTLNISPTHSQMYALDLEDPSICVWYTLGGTPVFTGATTSVNAGQARGVSSLFAASPRDGMNNYFLYSKTYGTGKVYYTGAGHMVVTGVDKDNNDERRLFINAVVNSVAKGVKKPKLQLYNVCAESNHTNCDDNYVNPDKDSENNELSKEMNTLYYNKSIGMYQYNIDETDEDVYPTFDFKAIAGSAPIRDIKVFYDMNYGSGAGMDKSDIYKDGTDKMILSYSTTSKPKADTMDGIRVNLNDSIKKLLLKQEYINPYNTCAYIVIYVKDAKNNIKTARVKINIVAHLFDLTDATIEYSNQSILPNNVFVRDMTDRIKFNI